MGSTRSAARRARTPLVVSASGVDGSGKSTLTRQLTEELTAAGLDVRRVWSRPGHGLGVFARVADALKRVRGTATETGNRQVMRDADKLPSSRGGITGWVWSMVVTVAYLIDVRRQHSRQGDVVLYDRHAVDAIVSLEVLYGSRGRGLQRALIRRFVPSADLTYYLEADVQTLVGRKPDSGAGQRFLESQVSRYDALVPAAGLRRLDANASPAALVAEVRADILAHLAFESPEDTCGEAASA